LCISSWMASLIYTDKLAFIFVLKLLKECRIRSRQLLESGMVV